MRSLETQPTHRVAEYDPPIVERTWALRALLPGSFESVHVYVLYESLVISHSPIEHDHDGVCAFSSHPQAMKLAFTEGALSSNSDPSKLRQRSATSSRVLLSSVTYRAARSSKR